MSVVGKNIDKALDRTRARTPAARTIIAQLARHADKELMSRPSQGLLARRAGIKSRQVRTYLRELEALNEIVPVKKGANRPTDYYLAILSDEVLERQPTATPNEQRDRQSTTGPKKGGSGSAASMEWQPTAYEELEERVPSIPASFKDREYRKVAENRMGEIPPPVPGLSSDSSNGTVAGNLDDHARENIRGLDEWVAEQLEAHSSGTRKCTILSAKTGTTF